VFYHDKAFFDFHGGDHDANINDIDDESDKETPKEEEKKIEKHEKMVKKQ